MAGSASAATVNITSYVRLRPQLTGEGERLVTCCSVDDSVTVGKDADSDVSQQQEDDQFYFDGVLDESKCDGASTASVSHCQAVGMEMIGKPLIEYALRGLSTCVIAYGPTGGGKSHTMVGTRGVCPGLVPVMMRSFVETVMSRCDKRFSQVTVHIAVFEMLNERFRDVGTIAKRRVESGGFGGSPLTRSATMSSTAMLRSKRVKSSSSLLAAAETDYEKEFTEGRVRTTPTGSSVDTLKLHAVESADEAESLAFDAARHRVANSRSSSSTVSLAAQTYFFIQCFVREVDKVGLKARSTTMTWVDCCGCERANRARSGQTLVYRSLHALRSVVDALLESQTSKGSRVSVPYRDSNLTLLLSDALGGSCRTVVVAAISPSPRYREDVVHALTFAQKIKNCVCSVATREEAVAAAVGALQKEVTLLKELAASGGSTVSAAQAAAAEQLRSELTSVEISLQSAASNREELERQKREIEEKLRAHEENLSTMQQALNVKTSMLEESKSIEQELTHIVEKQLTASQQIATEVALQEKRSVQLVMHRQRQASIVRRHENIVHKMESARTQAENQKKQEFALLFRNATALAKSRNDVRFYRSEIDRLLNKESALYTQLRALQAATSEATVINSEEQLKCDFLTEELDEVVEQWEDANRTRSEAICEHQGAMKTILTQLDQHKAALSTHQKQLDALDEEKHSFAFVFGIRESEAEGELERDIAAVAQLNAQLENQLAETSRLQRMLDAELEEESLLPERQRQLNEAHELRRRLEDKEHHLTNECEELETCIHALDVNDIPQTQLDCRAAEDNLKKALADLETLRHAHKTLSDYVRSRVFHHEHLSLALAADVSPPSLSRSPIR